MRGMCASNNAGSWVSGDRQGVQWPRQWRGTRRAASLLLTDQEASCQQGDSEQRSSGAWQGVRGAVAGLSEQPAANEVSVARAFILLSFDTHRLDTMHMPSTAKHAKQCP